MNTVRISLILCSIVILSGCAQRVYHWGEYEDSIHARYRDVSLDGQQKAFMMLERTIQEAERTGQRVPPGVYADYGYFLYRLNRPDEAIQAFRKEAELYRESRQLMESVISRVDAQRTKR